MTTAPDINSALQDPAIHESWESVYRIPDQRAFNDRLMRRLLAKAALPKGSLVLDAGCGTGEHSIRLAQHGFNCIGVDISEIIVEKAAKRVSKISLSDRVRFIWRRLERLRYPDAHFDAVHY